MALEPLLETLTEEERHRNTHGEELLFTSTKTPLGRLCAAACAAADAPPATLVATSAESPSFAGSVRHAAGRCTATRGTLAIPPGGQDYGLHAVPNLEVAGGVFTSPPYSAHNPRLLAGVNLPVMTLTQHDKPVYSRDSEQATRSMEQRFKGRGGGGGGGGYGGGGRQGGGGLPGRPTGAAQRMINGALGTGRR